VQKGDGLFTDGKATDSVENDQDESGLVAFYRRRKGLTSVAIVAVENGARDASQTYSQLLVMERWAAPGTAGL